MVLFKQNICTAVIVLSLFCRCFVVVISASIFDYFISWTNLSVFGSLNSETRFMIVSNLITIPEVKDII